MKKIILSSLVLLSFSSFAQRIETMSGTGEVQAKVDFDRNPGYMVNPHTQMRDIPVKLYVNTFAEGKIKGKLVFTSTIQTKCKAGISFDFIGIDQGVGEFDLYANSADLVIGKNKIGTYTDWGSEASITLAKSYAPKGMFNRNTCTVTISKDASIFIKKKN